MYDSECHRAQTVSLSAKTPPKLYPCLILSSAKLLKKLQKDVNEMFEQKRLRNKNNSISSDQDPGTQDFSKIMSQLTKW